jgi:hypothetical protein
LAGQDQTEIGMSTKKDLRVKANAGANWKLITIRLHLFNGSIDDGMLIAGVVCSDYRPQ